MVLLLQTSYETISSSKYPVTYTQYLQRCWVIKSVWLNELHVSPRYELNEWQQQYKATAAVHFKKTSNLSIWWVVFACLQHASGILEGMADLWLFYVILCPWGKCLSSADKQLEGSMPHLSVFVSFAHCMLYISHSDFDSWMPICDLWDTRLMSTYTLKRTQFGCSTCVNFWLTDKAKAK